MHDNVDFACECGRQRRGVVGEEVVSTSPPLDARARRQVEAEVGVGEKENADAVAHQVSTS